MHVVISWDIHGQHHWNEINEKLKACIASHSWVKPLNTLFVVKVWSVQDRDAIIEAMTNVARQHPSDVQFLCTPVMTGGSYNGWLPENMWNEINLRTN
ncbi:hypothetical protein [Pseudomonas putida]|uniref:hypothetical protein n=1 Tax=Pseudomonas putida TaxID=303 RepID=UPI001F51EEEE|nr:hypothetical protein [Pseudomonas putida]MCI0915277.1 hypothetical protein [Pseudomonas putida]